MAEQRIGIRMDETLEHGRRDASDLREEFVSLAAHELKTPVTVLKLQVQMARREMTCGPAAASVAHMLDVVDRQIGRLARLCDEMVDAAYVQVDDLAITKEEGDLAEIAGAAVELVREQRPIPAQLIRLRSEPGLVGQWDSERLCRAIAHLLENALTFGGGKPVELTVEAADGGARVTVRDQGIGIAKHDQARIFERFERAVPVRNFGGLGLGLYVARAIVGAHEGTIRVESELGEGASFIVHLPWAPAARRQEAA